MFHLREDHFSMFIPKWKVDHSSPIQNKNETYTSSTNEKFHENRRTIKKGNLYEYGEHSVHRTGGVINSYSTSTVLATV